MSGLKVSIEKKELVIRVPLEEPRKSTSGKNMVVASTSGNQRTGVKYPGTDSEIVLGLNAYYKP